MATLLKGISKEFKRLEQSNGDWKQYLKDQEEALKAIQARTTIVKQQVADSFAYYEVVKRSPLQIRYIPFCDAWEADPAWIRGLRISDVEAQERWNSMFTKVQNS